MFAERRGQGAAAKRLAPQAPRPADHNGTYATHVSVTVTADAGYQ
jgi:hypothetical protein